MMIPRRSSLAIAAFVMAASGTLVAEQSVQNLATASIEELMRISVTSASRKEQPIAEVPAAVFVITHETIRRSGLTSVPELLRLAPGVQVARIDASKWAISIRGFNKRWSDKLLVLVDGRTIFNRQFSGVYWDGVNLMLEDIDRIEVVRGPGGSVWGANAVDGVINVITKSSAETQGALVRASVGSQEEGGGAVRYGGALGQASYRAHVDWEQRGHSMLEASVDAPDRWRSFNGGVRLDWKAGADRFFVDAGGQRVDANSFRALLDGPVPPVGGWQPVVQFSDQKGGHALARWTRTAAGGRSVELQGFVEHADRVELAQRYRWTTADVDAKYHARIAGRHDVVTGVGYRRTDDRFDGTFVVSLNPAEDTLTVFNAFAQDEIRLAGDRLRLTVGAKLEHETFSDWGFQPTARALWAIGPRAHLWGAASRALRTPARVDRGLRVNVTSFPGPGGIPILIALQGNPGYQTEEVISGEGGIRFERAHGSLDVSGFYSDHQGMQTHEPVPPHIEIFNGQPALVRADQFDNLMHANSVGIEVSGRWSPVAWAHMDGSYGFFDLTAEPDPASLDEHAAEFDGNAPRHHWQLRPAATLGRVDADLAVARVGALESFGVPGYTRVDARVEWRLSPRWSVAVTGQNLSDSLHVEFGGLENATAVTFDPRRVTGKVTWRY